MDRNARRSIVALACLSAGLSVALALALTRLDRDGGSLGQQSFVADEVREAAVRELVSLGAGVYDSHPDADVGRVLLPRLEDRDYGGTSVSTNAYGMRERAWGPKEPGTLRVVLLGDSFVFGLGVPAEERAGAFLERYLAASVGPGVRVECLHAGVASWNLQAECAWMRRNLAWMRPDLVVQLVLPNDLADSRGVRGFGSKARHSPQARTRAGGLVDTWTRISGLERNVQNFLPLGLDWESRTRYALAAERVGRLAAAVRASGGAYLLVARWTNYQPMVPEHLASELAPSELAFVSDEFVRDESTWVAETDFHWNRAGHETFARMLYGLIRQRSLLPGLALPEWAEADEAVDRLHVRGQEEARRTQRLEKVADRRPWTRTLRFAELDLDAARQVYGGVDGTRVAPYVSLVFPGPARAVLVRGERLRGPGPAGRARVFCEELEIGSFELGGDAPIDERFPVPAELAERDHMSVRVESEDYAYEAVGAAYCVAFRADSIGVE